MATGTPVTRDEDIDSAPMSTSPRGAADTAEIGPPTRRATRRPGRLVTRRRVTIRRINPWSVFKFSLIFNFCVLLIVMLGLMIFWTAIIRLGLIEALQAAATEVGLELMAINGANIGRIAFLIGLVNVALWSLVNVFLAFLYNLIADLVGGIRITLAEDERGR